MSIEHSYSQLMVKLLQAIRRRDEDSEMDLRADLKVEFRLSEEQINSRLFRLLSEESIQTVQAEHDSVDLACVEQTAYLLDGWILKGDVSLFFGAYGTGKTSLLAAIAHAFASGTNLLDRSKPPERAGRVLFIATDSGIAPFKKALDDLGIDPLDPIFKPGDPEQRIWLWGHEPGQGQQAWDASVNGVIKLQKFIREKQIDFVAIDSAKSVSTRGGWSYTSNESVKNMLQYLREIICYPMGCNIAFLSHDGFNKGSASGAKAWSEEPSMVVELTLATRHDGSQTGVMAEFKKDRGGVRRKLTFALNRDEGCYELAPGTEIIGCCEDAIIEILYDAHRRGTTSLSRKDLVDEALAAYGKSSKTVDNTLGTLTGARRLVKPRRGCYSLGPGELQRKTLYKDLLEEGRNLTKSTAAQSECQVPGTLPDPCLGKTDLLLGKQPGTSQIDLLDWDSGLTPPSTERLPFEMEDVEG